jgi:hypothetical protein
MRKGPRNQWKLGDSSMPVPSRPNQIQTIHLAISVLCEGVSEIAVRSERVSYLMQVIVQPLDR